jgi:hypothetical protein
LDSKTAKTHFQAWLDLQIDPRVHGHSSVMLYHFVYDRAVLKPLFRLQRQYFQARYLRAKGLRHRADAELDWVHTLLTSAECYNHSAHKALEWAFMQYVRDETVLKSMFITVESLRRGYSEIMSHLPQWLGLRLQFEDSPPVDWMRVWYLCGVEPWVAEMMCDLELEEDEQSTLMGELLAKRAEAALAGEATGLTDFTWTVRGGVWAASHTGMMHDSPRASAATSQARLWCEERAMPLTATFAVNLYGDEGSMLMAAFWCSKMTWLMRSEAPLVGEPGDIERAARVGEFHEDPKIQDVYRLG